MLNKSASDKAIGPNIKTEMAAGKPYPQALAIALSTQDRARQGKRAQPTKRGRKVNHSQVI